MTDLLSRRRFIAALAVSVVSVGAPLPIGFPKKGVSFNSIDVKWTASGTGTISLKYWHIYEALKKDGADLDMDIIVVQINTQKLLTYDA